MVTVEMSYPLARQWGVITSQEQTETCCLHLHGRSSATLKMEAEDSSETLVASATLHDVTSQKITVLISTFLKKRLNYVYQYIGSIKFYGLYL
jgi:hypothetical protein